MDEHPQHIHDDNDPRGFWGMVPHLVRHLGFDVYARDLFGHYIMSCGLRGGAYRESVRQTAKQVGFSPAKVLEARTALRNAGLIWMGDGNQAAGIPDEIRIPKLWGINVRLYEDKSIPWLDRLDRARHELLTLKTCSPYEQGCSRGDTDHKEDLTTPYGVVQADFLPPEPVTHTQLQSARDGQVKKDKPLALSTRITKCLNQEVERDAARWLFNSGGPEQVVRLLREIVADAEAAEGGRLSVDLEERLLADVVQGARDVMATFPAPQPGRKNVLRFDRIPAATRSARAARLQHARDLQPATADNVDNTYFS